MLETPSILGTTYGTSTVDYILPDQFQCDRSKNDVLRSMDVLRSLQNSLQINQPQQKQEPTKNMTRIVRVYIADTDENIPLEKRLLHTSDEKLTECTDQELFFEIPIKDIIDKHNSFRITVRDKKQSEKCGKEIMLEPIKIRDLKMIVVSIASF